MGAAWSFTRAILDAEVQSSDDATKIVKLPMSNYLHTLWVKAKVTNGATSAKNQSVDDVIDRIEVIANGSDVLYSLTPIEIKRWSLWMLGINVPQNRDESASAVQECVYPLFFGRGVFDPDYYLPCARLSDLEIRIKYSPTIGATAFATGTVTLSVLGLYTMSAPPAEYRGTLTTKAIKAFTSAASGDDQTLIPRGNMLRQLMVSCYESAIADGVDITRVAFDLNNNEVVPFNLAWNDISDMNRTQNWVNHVENITALLADTNTLNTKVGRIRGCSLSPFTADDATADEMYFRRVVSFVGDQITVEGFKGDFTSGASDLVTDATARKCLITVHGEGLSHAVVLDFSYLGEQSLLNTAAYDQVRLTLTQGGAGGDTRISSQEVRQL